MTPLFETLIDAVDLRSLLSSGAAVVVLDSGFDLFDPAAGDRAYAAGHLPGALRADLDRDLSGAKTGRNGRHPLPARELFAVTAGRWGIAPGVQVVVYDDQGASFAARAWWMLRWIGHRAVAVLDGGRGAWVAAGGPLETGVVEPRPAARPYPIADGGAPTIDADALQSALHRLCIVDARAGERFRGEVEPLDPVAGHIPGARHRFFRDNLAADGRFKPAVVLRAEFEALAVPADRVVHQCGSGVTACHNLLAMEHAGLAGSVLYPGSWSEWCADPARPVARG
ncbi:MAG: sulfurtransferase [Rubrivivax sp.]|jgi:thiosulfate/3-mercaptopyruvate sulfurtransferase|nr:sulfurtransferase [Rubrivivax sp.]